MRGTVLLDLYGTLVEPDWAELREGRTAIAERAGVGAMTADCAWDKTHIARMTGAYGSLADDLAAVFSEAADGAQPRLSPSTLRELADAELRNWRRGVAVYPDVLPALGRLRSLGLRLVIVTNASAEAASVIDALGLRPVVDEVFVSCEVGVLKPALLRVALRTLGLDASDATLVDDDPAQLDSAGELGLTTILVDRTGAGVARASGTGHHPRVTDLGQMANLVAGAEPARRR